MKIVLLALGSLFVQHAAFAQTPTQNIVLAQNTFANGTELCGKIKELTEDQRTHVTTARFVANAPNTYERTLTPDLVIQTAFITRKDICMQADSPNTFVTRNP